MKGIIKKIFRDLLLKKMDKIWISKKGVQRELLEVI